MPAQLLALTDGPSILLDKPILLFGRDLECDVRFDSRKISRKHCCIAQVSDYLVVRDLGSTNGVRINGVRVLEGRLSAGDEVTIGNCRYQVRWDEQALAPRSPPAVKPALAPRPRDTTEGDDDAMLELCDEPVPLPEPATGRSLPEALPVEDAASVPEKPPQAASAVLPDHLSLIPMRDSALRGPDQGPAA